MRHHHFARQIRRFAYVVHTAGRYVVGTVQISLRHLPREEYAQLGFEIFHGAHRASRGRVDFIRHEDDLTRGYTTVEHCNLANLVVRRHVHRDHGLRGKIRHHRVSFVRLELRNEGIFEHSIASQTSAATSVANERLRSANIVDAIQEVTRRRKRLLALRTAHDGRLGEVLDVGAAETGSLSGEVLVVQVGIDTRRERWLVAVQEQDFLTRFLVWQTHLDDAIKTTGTNERRIEHLRTVRRRQHHDARGGRETVHLRQHLIDRRRRFVVTVNLTGLCLSTLRADGIEFIDEDDARRNLLGLIKQVANTRGSDADKHLHKLRTCAREERHIRLARDTTSEQSFTRTGRAAQKHTCGDARAHGVVLVEILQVGNEFKHLRLDVVDAGDVLQRHPLANVRVVVARRHVTKHVFGAILVRAFVNKPRIEYQHHRRRRVEHERHDLEPARILLHLNLNDPSITRSLGDELFEQNRIVRKVATEHLLRVVDVISNARLVGAVHHAVDAPDVE